MAYRTIKHVAQKNGMTVQQVKNALRERRYLKLDGTPSQLAIDNGLAGWRESNPQSSYHKDGRTHYGVWEIGRLSGILNSAGLSQDHRFLPQSVYDVGHLFEEILAEMFRFLGHENPGRYLQSEDMEKLLERFSAAAISDIPHQAAHQGIWIISEVWDVAARTRPKDHFAIKYGQLLKEVDEIEGVSPHGDNIKGILNGINDFAVRQYKQTRSRRT